MTVWRIVSVETVSSGEELITLHSRATFGSLPELIEDQIPSDMREEVLSALDQVADYVFRSSPVALADSCRSALTVVLSRWLAWSGDPQENLYHLDLGDLAKKLEQRYKETRDHAGLKNATRLVQIFHSRGKPNEQVKYDTRPVCESDAQLALEALGFILREIGWAR
jgi:hypothetical protein